MKPILSCILSSLLFLTQAQTPALADDQLHEGTAVSTGIRSDKNLEVSGKQDLSLIPVPGGASINGSRLDLTLTMPIAGKKTDATPTIEKARAEVLRLHHFHLLGIERDKRQGTPFSIEAVGVYIPTLIKGNIGDPTWMILQSGANLNYRAYDRNLNAARDGKGGGMTFSCRLDENFMLNDKFSLRAFQEIAETLMAGHQIGASDDKAGIGHSLVLSAGAGIYYRLSSEGLYRTAYRTDPRTGEREKYKVLNEGLKINAKLFDFSTEYNALDNLTNLQGKVLLKATGGINVDF